MERFTNVVMWRQMSTIHLFYIFAGLSPYDGVVYHESPLQLFLFTLLDQLLVQHSVLVYIAGDLLTCYLLSRLGQAAALAMLSLQRDQQESYHSEAKSLLIPNNFYLILSKVPVPNSCK
jgi:hypothetical protein